jgi:hypothetical protein
MRRHRERLPEAGVGGPRPAKWDGARHGPPGADGQLREQEPEVHAGLLRLRDLIRGNPEWSARIRALYSIKNTIGYGLNSFLDHDRAVDILGTWSSGARAPSPSWQGQRSRRCRYAPSPPPACWSSTGSATRPVAQAAWKAAAGHWDAVTRTGSLALSAARHLPAALPVTAIGAARAVLGDEAVPRYSPDLPPGGRRGKLSAARPEAVFFASCTATLFGAKGAGAGEAFARLCARTGIELRTPDDLPSLCCGTPWKSKGLAGGYEAMRARVAASLRHAAEDGHSRSCATRHRAPRGFRSCSKRLASHAFRSSTPSRSLPSASLTGFPRCGGSHRSRCTRRARRCASGSSTRCCGPPRQPPTRFSSPTTGAAVRSQGTAGCSIPSSPPVRPSTPPHRSGRLERPRTCHSTERVSSA